MLKNSTGRGRTLADDRVNVLQKLGRLAGPHPPLGQEPAHDPNLLYSRLGWNLVGGQKIDEKSVIVSGVEGKLLVPSRLAYRPHHLDGLKTIVGAERKPDQVVDRDKLPPKVEPLRPRAVDVPAEVPHDRHDLRDSAEVVEQLRIAPSRGAERSTRQA